MMKYDGTHATGKRMTRRIVVAAAATALAAVTGVGAAQAGTASTGAGAALPTCTAAGLAASLHQPLVSGMNHQGAVLELKNTSSRTCALLGYPGLGLENAQHKALTTRTDWGSTWYAGNPGKKLVELKPGQAAQAVLAWTHANTGTSGAAHAAYLEITPPASTTHKTVAFKNWADHGELAVTALAHHIAVTD